MIAKRRQRITELDRDKIKNQAADSESRTGWSGSTFASTRASHSDSREA